MRQKLKNKKKGKFTGFLGASQKKVFAVGEEQKAKRVNETKNTWSNHRDQGHTVENTEARD